MMDDSPKPEQVVAWGLCASCAHALVIVNDRGSRFVQCALARIDPGFPKYPPLPVVTCAGFERTP
jgi:hypothetical protein